MLTIGMLKCPRRVLEASVPKITQSYHSYINNFETYWLIYSDHRFNWYSV